MGQMFWRRSSGTPAEDPSGSIAQAPSSTTTDLPGRLTGLACEFTRESAWTYTAAVHMPSRSSCFSTSGAGRRKWQLRNRGLNRMRPSRTTSRRRRAMRAQPMCMCVSDDNSECGWRARHSRAACARPTTMASGRHGVSARKQLYDKPGDTVTLLDRLIPARPTLTCLAISRRGRRRSWRAVAALTRGSASPRW
jgi:hypothetical protein